MDYLLYILLGMNRDVFMGNYLSIVPLFAVLFFVAFVLGAAAS